MADLPILMSAAMVRAILREIKQPGSAAGECMACDSEQGEARRRQS